jgi:hypothetical protein
MIYWVDNGGSYSDHDINMWNVPDEVAADFETWMATKPGGFYIVARSDFAEAPREDEPTSFAGYFDGDERSFGYISTGVLGHSDEEAKWDEIPASVQCWLIAAWSHYPRMEWLAKRAKPAPTDEERAAKRRAWAEGRAVRIRRQDMANEVDLDPHSTKAAP